MQKLGARLHVASQAGKPRHTLSVAPPERAVWHPVDLGFLGT